MNKFFFNFFIKPSLFVALIYTSLITYAASEPGVSAFMYHRFGEDKFPSTNISEAQLLAHINYVVKNKIRVLSLGEVIKRIENGDKFSEKVVSFSVDDAYKSFYEIAWPIFRDNNIPVTLFVSTDIIDKKTKNYMTWDQIKVFIDEGGSIGQHTSTHPHLPLNTSEFIKKDILDSHKSFIKNLGFIPNLFAYPYGESSEAVISILKEFGITHAFGQHSGVISSYDNPYYLPRFSLNEKFGEIDRFEFAVNAHSLQVIDLLPSDMFLINEKKPLIEFTLVNNLNGSSLDCFSNPGNKWDLQELVNIKSNRFQIKLIDSYKPGRARLNCTTKIGNNWHWFGYQFLVK